MEFRVISDDYDGALIEGFFWILAWEDEAGEEENELLGMIFDLDE